MHCIGIDIYMGICGVIHDDLRGGVLDLTEENMMYYIDNHAKHMFGFFSVYEIICPSFIK